jgi:hypothetical protein
MKLTSTETEQRPNRVTGVDINYTARIYHTSTMDRDRIRRILRYLCIAASILQLLGAVNHIALEISNNKTRSQRDPDSTLTPYISSK